MKLDSGAEFAGFRIVRRLGAGGMGEVYLVEHPRLPRQEALKVLAQSFAADAEYRQRFLREADLAAKLWHPNLVSLHDTGETDGRLWISMDYVDGPDTAELVRAQYPNGMPAEGVADIVSAVASALDYAHQSGMLHRDVKPANILYSRPAVGEARIALADFGIAREINNSQGITATDMTVGTVAYAAPEQLMGGPIDGRADQYALAATAFQLLTGAPPFKDSNAVTVISQHLTTPPPKLSERRPDLAALDMVFDTALAKDPAQRYPNCTEFARDFARRVADTQAAAHATATQPAVPAAAGHQARRVRGRWIAAGATAALLLAGAALAARSDHESPSGTAESSQASTQQGTGVTIESIGFGRPVDSGYLWVTSTVRGVSAGDFAVVSFNVIGADGTILMTESQTEQAVNPNATMIIGRQVTVPRDKKVSRIEATVGITPLDGPAPKLQNVVLQVSDDAVGEDALGTPTAEAVIRNPSTQPVANARVGIACFDSAGSVIGGGSNYPDLIAPGAAIKIVQSVLVSEKPDRCDVSVQPSDF